MVSLLLGVCSSNHPEYVQKLIEKVTGDSRAQCSPYYIEYPEPSAGPGGPHQRCRPCRSSGDPLDSAPMGIGIET